MITVSLKTLNENFQALQRVAVTVKKGKIAYRLGRCFADAKKEIDLMGEHIKTIAQEYGAEIDGMGGYEFRAPKADAPESEINAFKARLDAFNREAKDFMQSHEVELWGKPEFFKYSEFESFEIAASDLAALSGWLIPDEAEEEAEKPKAASVAA